MSDAAEDADPSRPLSRDELADGAPYNGTVARTLLDQGILALNDLLDSKKQFEVKAIALLAAMAPAAAATIGGPVIGQDVLKFELIWLLSGALFVVAAVACVFSLREMQYGAPGLEDPRDWLCDRWLRPSEEGVEKFGDAEKAARLHAMLAHDIGAQIRRTIDANKDKIEKISAAIYFGMFGAAAALVAAVLEVMN